MGGCELGSLGGCGIVLGIFIGICGGGACLGGGGGGGWLLGTIGPIFSFSSSVLEWKFNIIFSYTKG